MRGQVLSLLFILALLSPSAPAAASIIYVAGDQTGTWSADTVIVTAEVRVPPGQMLTIQPGVEVLFSVYCKLIVDNGATLRAVGTPADSIRFDVLPPNVNWHGIRFLSASDSSRLEYCLLTHGYATGSGEDSKGGAIYCFNSSPTISGNTIIENTTVSDYLGGGIYCSGGSSIISGNSITENIAGDGGGVYCSNSNPIISGNTLSDNSANGRDGGGGIFCFYSSPNISGNIIADNHASSISYGRGGGIYCYYSNPNITGNIINGNIGPYGGGGILCRYSNPAISGNTISGNFAWTVSLAGQGGGIFCLSNSSPSISNNTISGNLAAGGGGITCWGPSSAIIRGNTISDNISNSGMPGGTVGGGIICVNSSASLINNTISGNSAVPGEICVGGGIYCSGGNSIMLNSILWANSPDQLYGTLAVTYCNIQDTLWPGIGNISAYPAFVDTTHSDYRLQWGSPCIDTGDPNPIYNDPDGTRADMGAWYYDQSLPVRILLTPYNQPIQIPASGGSFQYAVQATNIADSALITTLWCDLTLPSGTIFGPVLGPVRISLASGQTISRVRTQNISAHAPAGTYHYNAYAVAEGDTSTDSFVFTKLGSGIRDSGFGGWTNTGEEFESPSLTTDTEELRTYNLELRTSPNPFNPSTVLSYQLPVASHVSLGIYDATGRRVTTLADGWRDTGDHQITFDGSGLPSGIYFAKLKAGDYTAVQKMVLMK